MRLLKTLYAKLSLVLVALLILVGVVFFVIAKVASDMYYQEITQRLNVPVAQYVANALPLIKGNKVNHEALKGLASQVMMINPTLEVYLLDIEGNILAHALGKNVIKRDRVGLNAIHEFIGRQPQLPFFGDDPRSENQRRIFTAAEIRHGGALEGYIYVILGGATYQALAASLQDSYVLKVSLAAIIACLVFGLLCGLIIFFLLTRRLHGLTVLLESFWSVNSTGRPDAVSKPNDEIEQLAAAFLAMSERIEQQMQQIQQTDQARRELVANFSHDLRTPLATMQGYVETLLLKRDELSAAEQKRYLETARKHGLRLSRLVAGLFELAKLDSYAVMPHFEVFSLAELANDIVQEFGLRAGSNGVAISVDSEGRDCIVLADISLIERVLQNLIDNALRYTPADGKVNILLQEKGRHVQVKVSDNGCGINAEALPYIFDRFYHSKKQAVESDLESTGLGLAIVKRILDLHETRIEVHSRVNVGTEFSFNLECSASAVSA